MIAEYNLRGQRQNTGLWRPAKRRSIHDRIHERLSSFLGTGKLQPEQRRQSGTGSVLLGHLVTMHETKMSVSAKGKSREDAHWQLGWWDLHALTETPTRYVAVAFIQLAADHTVDQLRGPNRLLYLLRTLLSRWFWLAISHPLGSSSYRLPLPGQTRLDRMNLLRSLP